MRRIILILLCFNFFAGAYNQVIKGTVFDKKTKEAIIYATIYFGGTFVGTYSDENGNFKLDIANNASMPLTISAIGYYSVTLTDFSSAKPLLVYLNPKVYEMKEVVVSAKSLTSKRRANLIIFKNEFLGNTSNAQDCEILNENDITFNYGSDKDTLKAFASKPILIDNKALGYKITYFLDKFEYVRKSKTFLFEGSIIFKEDLLVNESEKQGFERRRKYVYLGSRMHFFRTLWAEELKSSGFKIGDALGEILNIENVVVHLPLNRKALTYRDNLSIYYYSKLPTSTLVFLKDRVYFDKNGYYEPSGIIWEGKLAMQRIGDLLPYEYTVPE